MSSSAALGQPKVGVVWLSENGQQSTSRGTFPGGYEAKNVLEEVLNKAHRLASPGGVEGEQSGGVDEYRQVAFDVDIHEVEKGLGERKPKVLR